MRMSKCAINVMKKKQQIYAQLTAHINTETHTFKKAVILIIASLVI